MTPVDVGGGPGGSMLGEGPGGSTLGEDPGGVQGEGPGGVMFTDAALASLT